MRRTTPDLTKSDLSSVEVRFDESARWLTMRRGAVTLAVSFADTSQTVPLPEGSLSLILATDDSARLDAAGAQLPGVSAALFRNTPA